MQQGLRNLPAFKSALKAYTVSDEGKAILRASELVLLAAPTSSGRNTIINKLVESGEYQYVVSDTTRPPRENNGRLERNGVEYWFRSEEEVLHDIKAGQFLEAAIIHDQQVSGISIRELSKAKQSGKIPVTDIEIVGVESILAIKPDTTVIFVVPPSFEQWHERLQQRGAMITREVVRRMRSACSEFTHALEHDHYHYVVNDKLPAAVEHIQELVSSKHQDEAYQARVRALIEKLLLDTSEFLEQHQD